MFGGSNCEKCRCLNQGVCAPSGDYCQCPGAWGGPICQECHCPRGQYCDDAGNCLDCVVDECGECFGTGRCSTAPTRSGAADAGELEMDLFFGLTGALSTAPRSVILANGFDRYLGPRPASNPRESAEVVR